MGKNTKKKERLPFNIAKDSQNLLRLKLKELGQGVSKRYSKIPKNLWSSFIIVLGIFAIVLIALFTGGQSDTQIPSIDDQSLSSLTDIIIDEEGQFRAQVPSAPEIGLNDGGLNLDTLTQAETAIEEESTSTAKILTNPEVVEGIQPASFKALYPLRRQGAIITDFGWYLHPILDVWRYHQGIDIRCKKNDLVMAVAAGKVIALAESDQEMILITLDHGNGWTSVYGQIAEVKVKVGDQVSKGQEIGNVGQSASAIEPHLHFELHKDQELVNPVTCLQ